MPKIFVFDLDFTLWNTGGVWCDCTTPPYKSIHGKIYDSKGKKLSLYPDALIILTKLENRGIEIAIASRTEQPAWAKELLLLFKIDRFFKYKEIYPAGKIKHLSKISQESGYKFSEMIFFDDEYRNIEDALSIGVNAIHVKNGIQRELININL